MILVGGMTRMPAIQRKVEEIFGKGPQGRQPRRGRGRGAAIQGGVLTGRGRGRAAARRHAALARRRDPGRRRHQDHRAQHDDSHLESQVFSTTEDNQTVVRIHVVQGEREMAADNKTLGRFELVGHSAGAARRSADRGHLRDRRRRRRQRVRQGPRHGQVPGIRGHRVERSPSRRSSAWWRRPRSTPRPTNSAASWRPPQQGRRTHLLDGAHPRGVRRQRQRPRTARPLEATALEKVTRARR